ncbi:MAG: N-6 DNA methylase [Bacteroidota bacterium]
MNEFAQYYTDNNVSELLLSKFTNNTPDQILDLGVGMGSLMEAAISRWQNAAFFGCDIDPNSVEFLSTKFPRTRLFVINGLSSKLHRKLGVKIGSIDIAICNPPYQKICSQNKAIYKSLLRKVGLGCIENYELITTDLIFLAQNLKLLNFGGELGIILPDGVFSSKSFEYFRAKLFQNHNVQSIVQLPRGVFKKTDALTHILMLKKGGSSTEIKLCRWSPNKEDISKEIAINYKCLIHRADYSYHSVKYNVPSDNCFVSLGDIGAEIFRGRKSKKYLHDSGATFLHINNIKFKKEIEQNPNSVYSSDGEFDVREGDFVMIRVGRNGIGLVSEVKSGRHIISDCLFGIRVPNKWRKIVLNSLRAPYASEWFLKHSKGVAAKVISKTDLNNFPIQI